MRMNRSEVLTDFLHPACFRGFRVLGLWLFVKAWGFRALRVFGGLKAVQCFRRLGGFRVLVGF